MRPARTKFLGSVLAFLGVFSLVVGSALAAGSITYSKKEVQEANGGWHLMMTIVYGGKPNTAHVPMRFSFTPTAVYENYLDDQHGDRPQKRIIPLVGQTPLNESVDVDFADPRGKMFDRTRFDFTITRSHNFAAGEYSVTVHRADGNQVGTAQTIRLLGDNPVIDRRAISFVSSSGKKDKDKDKDKDKAASATDNATAAAEKPPAAAGEGVPPTPAADTATSASDKPAGGDTANDPAASEKVPPSSRGCGCRTAGRPGSALVGVLSLGMSAVLLRRARRRRPTLPL
jgi:hypothetical protein